MLSLFRTRTLRNKAIEALQRRVEALEAAQVTFNLERNHLITLITSSENRLRAMLGRAEKLAAPPAAADHSHLDRALAARKGF